MNIQLGKLEHVDARKLWNSKSGEFTPWLASNISLLGEALGIDIEVVQTEKAVGDFSCDIQAHDTGRDRPVIIENQLEPTDHRHLGQLLTYAAGLDAAVIVWISPEVREEHREALDWLNRHTDDRIEFFGVSLEAVRIDNSNPAVQFRLVAFPNAWSKRVTTSSRSEATEKERRYQEFFQGVLDELREKHKFTNARVASLQNWLSLASGIPGISYLATFARENKLRAAVYIDFKDVMQNKSFFDALLARKEEIEQKTGPLEWDRLDEKRASRISLVRPNTSIDNATTQGNEIRNWLEQALLRMKSTFGPMLDSVADNPL